jgi:hypothetical protein
MVLYDAESKRQNEMSEEELLEYRKSMQAAVDAKWQKYADEANAQKMQDWCTSFWRRRET